MTGYILQALGDLDDNERQEMAGFCLGFFTYEILQKGELAFGIKDNDDSIRALAIVREYLPDKEITEMLLTSFATL
jgi:hypothetical protein